MRGKRHTIFNNIPWGKQDTRVGEQLIQQCEKQSYYPRQNNKET